MKINFGFATIAAYIVFVGSMVTFAIKVSQQNYDLVTEKYYDKAVNFQQEINARNNGVSREAKISLAYDQDSNSLSVTSVDDIQGRLLFYKPDNARNDFEISFTAKGGESNAIPLKKLQHGKWRIKADWNCGGQLCYAEKDIYVK